MNFDEMVKTEPEAVPKRGIELRRQPVIVVGGLPTVSLLPREFLTAARGKTLRRAMVGAVALAAVIALAATALAATNASMAQQQLDAANAQSQALVAQLAKFSDVQQLQKSVQVGQAAVKVGASTEIDWQAQVEDIERDMPAGYSVVSINGDSANVILGYQQGTTPLEQPRAATIVLQVTSPTVTELPVWLRKLRSIPAYADATATFGHDEQAGYTEQITVHLSPKALVNAEKSVTK